MKAMVRWRTGFGCLGRHGNGVRGMLRYGSKSKEEGKYQELMQSSSTPDQRHRMVWCKVKVAKCMICTDR